MKKHRNTPLYLGLIAVILVVMISGVYSYMFKKTNTISNTFLPGTVRCVVDETLDQNEKTEIFVKNTGNVDTYVRVRLVTYWVNDKDAVMSKPSKELSVTLANGWIAGDDNTYYYPEVIKPGESTLNLLGDHLELTQEGNCYQAIDVFAEAIQANPTKAVTESWKVTITNGKITAVLH